ncbi:Heparinase II/III N-terminus [Sinosporangium album]|uniref:Heparinase II/III N-terminus n=1 Tax=Sinosporangium album TaxID=504805 RepID=A0A1G8AX22_9ACTN|nr:heparinase II/III family protein [Sinosporangium album]SDH25478.1 Heparinase II/III N-terminus [Sinosporangium album]
MRRRTRALGLTLALSLACAGTFTTSQAANATGKRTAECQGDWLPSTPTSADVMKGELSFVGLPAAKVGKNVDWRWSPYKNRSWEMVFHSLRWMGRLVADYEVTGEKRYLTRAVEVAKDWVKDNPRGRAGISAQAWAEHPIALRAPALVCLSKHVGDAWLRGSLAEHAVMLSDPKLYEKGHNHGIDQDIALLGIGCRYKRDTWSNLATRRLIETVELDVDPQGALREQAPRYGLYVYQRLNVAITNMKDCGRTVPDRILTRWKALESYIAHSTQPNGFMVPIGDGAPDVRPIGFAEPKERVKLFRSAGYAYGRTNWGKPESAFYSLRFGPGRKHHGHEDHMGVTYYAQGRDILVDTGFHSYENTPYRWWTMSPEAHNVPTVVGRNLRPSTPTALVKADTGRDRQTYRLTDKAYGVSRTRSVLVNHDEDLMAVLDTAASGAKIRNLWHFDASLKVTSNKGGQIVLKDKDFATSLVQLAMPTCKPIGGQTIARGQTKPYQGWVSPTYMQRVPAAAVVSPAAPALLTVVVPGTDTPSVTCSGNRVTVNTANGSASFRASGANLS